MRENTNSTIAINSIVLYIKLFICSICGLFTTRFALTALGATDFGLFSVLGGITSFIAIVNTIMISSSHRFIAVSIGKGDEQEVNIQFNVCFIIHCAIAFISLIIALPIGEWYIHNYINYSGDINNALMVFRITAIASIASFVGVPFNALLSAKEKFSVFCIPEALASVVKLIMSYLLIYFFTRKLIVYAVTISLLTILPILFYVLYCRRTYRAIVKFRFVNNPKYYTDVLSFSGWVSYGAVAYVGKSQGAALILNAFCNTIINTALGIANSIISLIGMFAQNVAQPIAPQITKSYASKNEERTFELLVMSIKYTYMIMLIAASPFLIDCKWIFSIWLGQVPEYAVKFTILLIIDSLIESLNSGIKNIIFANGNIILFQIIPSSLKLASIVFAYVSLKNGNTIYSLLYIYLVFSVIIVLTNQWILHKTVRISISRLFKCAYAPSLIVTILFCPVLVLPKCCHPLFRMLIAVSILFFLVYIFGLNHIEKEGIKNHIMKIKLMH